MSSTADTPPNYSSDTKHDSGCIPRLNFFDAFPNELIIYILSFLSLPAVVRFASTSRQHRSIASADQIWLPVALGIIQDNVDPNDTLVDEEFMRRNCNRLLAALGLSTTDTTQAWYWIATKLLERVEWTLGWWLGKADGFTKGCLWRIFIEIDEADPGNEEHDERFFRVMVAQVEVVETDEYNLLLQPGSPLSVAQIATGISALQLVLEGNTLPCISAEGFVPLGSRLVSRGFRSGYLSLSGQVPIGANSSRHSARKLQDHLPHLSMGADFWKGNTSREWRSSLSDAPYPPPLLDQLLDQREGQHARGVRRVPSIALSPVDATMRTLLSVRRPSSFPKVANELVQTGIYVAPYGSHGWEYLLVRVREFTEDDFKVTWPWEGSMAVSPSSPHIAHEVRLDRPHSHLGPFSDIAPVYSFTGHPVRVSKDHVRRGSRVLEGIKIKGDADVPGGQRSFIAFLDDPLVQPEALQEAEETFPEVSPERQNELPWPFVSREPATTGTIDWEAYKQSYLSPEQGIDIPGVMRVAETEFCLPHWIRCVVHVECKTRFTVAPSATKGMVFRKLNDWVV